MKASQRFCLIVLPFLFGGALFAQTNSPAAKFDSQLLTVEGSVQVMAVGGTNWSPGQTNEALHIGDRLRTGVRSRATVRLSDLSVLRVNELTTLQIRAPQQAGKQSMLDLNSGSTYFLGREKPAEQEFRTPLTSGAIRGTEFNLAVAEDGRTVVTLIDGQVTLSNALGQVNMSSGEQGTVDPGQPPVKTAMLEAINVIQWCLYYPGVLDASELELTADEQQALSESLAAYNSGDLLQAVARYPADRSPASDADRVYRAATLLSAGQSEQAEALLAGASTNEQSRSAKLAGALREVIAVVKNQRRPGAASPTLATEWLAESYYFQSQGRLVEALAAARSSVAKSPNFGFGWARVAELELSFGHLPIAMDALDRSLKLSPRNAQSLAVKGFILSAQNRVREAQRTFDEAIALDGALGNAWLGRALCEIHRGQSRAGLHDLQVAAVLEPQRSVLRSYLGKAFSNAGDDVRARKELGLARQFDPNDPTSWLYSALVNQEQNQINQGVKDLEKSEELNDNRRLFRSRLLLDEDQAVRSANLANIYQDAGMFDWSVREATRAVDLDYGNYSAHQFLANSYDALRDPKLINLRYETPWFSELLVSDLLSPVSAGNLSEFISQREYSRLFEENHFGASSLTEYSSHGDWLERGSQYGTYDDVTYAADAEYRYERGFRPSNSVEQLTMSFKAKDQITPQDSLFIEGVYFDSSFQDSGQFYNQYGAIPNVPAPSQSFNGTEREHPNIFIGYHHEWAPGIHTLFLGSHLEDNLRYRDDTNTIPFVAFYAPNPALPGNPGAVFFPPNADIFQLRYGRQSDDYTAELQQIFQTERQTLVAGVKYQLGFNTTFSSVNDQNNFPTTLSEQDITTRLQRYSAYGYETLKVCDSLQLIGGVTYDRLRYPRDIDTSPITGVETDTEQVSPKAGLIWSPTPETHLRAAYTRSLGGVFDENSVRLEPVQVAGFTQAYRSIAPESVVGIVPGSRFTTYGVGLDQSFKSHTYLSIDGEILTSEGRRTIGIVTNQFQGFPFPEVPPSDAAGNTRQNLNYTEKSLVVSLNQLVDRDWSLGTRYQLSRADLSTTFADLPGPVAATVNQNVHGTFQQLLFYVNYNHPCGFFAQGQSLWTAQHNTGYTPGLDSTYFWQFNAFAGYRFLQRQAEIKIGILNINNQNYLLNPLNLYTDLPRDRTLTVTFKFYF